MGQAGRLYCRQGAGMGQGTLCSYFRRFSDQGWIRADQQIAAPSCSETALLSNGGEALPPSSEDPRCDCGFDLGRLHVLHVVPDVIV